MGFEPGRRSHWFASHRCSIRIISQLVESKQENVTYKYNINSLLWYHENAESYFIV